MSEPLNFSMFARRAANAHGADPRRLALAGQNLIDGALRIRRESPPPTMVIDNDDVIGSWLPAVTRPTEAIGAWLKSLNEQVESGEPFFRAAEMREAVIAAGEQVHTAVEAAPHQQRLRSALYTDALDAIGGTDKPSMVPWIVCGAIGGGILISLLVLILRKR